MRHVRLFTGAAVLAAAAHAVQAAPMITTYTTAATFDAANPSAVLEQFNALIAPGVTDTQQSYDYGFFTIQKEYAQGNTGSRAGDWRGRPSGTLADVITFDRQLVAWGADFNTQEGGDGTGVSLTVQITVDFILNNITVGTVGAGSSPNAGFLGFTSDTPFDKVRITSVAQGNDTYTLDNMRYGVVPLPGSIALLGAGLLGLGALSRRRNRT